MPPALQAGSRGFEPHRLHRKRPGQLGANVRPAIGAVWVDRTTTERLERVLSEMDVGGKSTSTIDRSWNYLNQACQFALRQRRIKVNPAADVLLPAQGVEAAQGVQHRAGPAVARRGHPGRPEAGSDMGYGQPASPASAAADKYSGVSSG